MAMEYEYTVTLHGNKEKLKWAEGIIDKAVYNSSPEMEDFLQEYAISVSDGYKDADCHHLSLLAMLFCKTDKKETVANEAWRDFLSGCYLKEDDTLDVYCRIAGNVDGFFRSLVEHSDYLESYDAVCEDDDDYENGEEYEEYVVILHGDKKKLKWAEGIIKEATNNTSTEMGYFLSKYSILMPENCFNINCNALSLLAILFCEEDVEAAVTCDSFYDFITGCNLEENGALKVVCRMDSDVDDFFYSLLEYSNYLSSYDVRNGMEETDGGACTGEEGSSTDDEEMAENPISKPSAPLMIEIYGDDDRLEMVRRIIVELLTDESTSCGIAVLPVVFSPMNEQAPLAGLGEGVSIVDIDYEIYFGDDCLSVKCQLNKNNNESFNLFLQRLCESSPFINRITLKNDTTSYNFTKGNLAQPVNAF